MPKLSEFLKAQKAEVFAAVRRAGLDPAEFRWSDVKSLENPRNKMAALVFLRDTDPHAYFLFDEAVEYHSCDYSPGAEAHHATEYVTSWLGVISQVKRWLDSLCRELETPDPWVAIEEAQELLEAGAPGNKTDDNSPFLPEELKRVSASLREIKEYLVATQKFTKAQTSAITRRLEYLEGAAQRMGRKDWTVLALGTLSNIIVVAALAPEQARELIRIAASALSWLISGQPLLSP